MGGGRTWQEPDGTALWHSTETLFVGPVQMGTQILTDAQNAIVSWRRVIGILETPADLVGKKLGAPVFDAGRKAFPIFAKANGITGVQWTSMDPPLRETMLVRGDVDAITGFTFTSLLNLEARGVKAGDVAVLPYADFGVKLYGNAIVVSPKLLKENPGAMKAFLQAFTKGAKEVIANPAAAIDVHPRVRSIAFVVVHSFGVVHAGADAGVVQALQHGVGKHFAADDAGFDQLQESVDEHLRAAIEPFVKTVQITPGQSIRTDGFEDAPVFRTVPVAHDQRLDLLPERVERRGGRCGHRRSRRRPAGPGRRAAGLWASLRPKSISYHASYIRYKT